jgi:N-acetylmuramoyl-L-alanine amidase
MRLGPRKTSMYSLSIPRRRFALAALLCCLILPSRALAADTAPPKVTGPSPSVCYFSPNGDGVQDVAAATIRVSEACRVTARVVDGSGAARATLASGRKIAAGAARFTWSGRVSGSPLADGTYYLKVYVRDLAGNRAGTYPRVSRFVIDTARPTASLASVGPTPFSPNRDGRRDTTALTISGSEALAGTLTIRRGTSAVLVRSVRGSRTLVVRWDGLNAAKRRQPNGTYRMAVAARDLAGNPGPTLAGLVRLDVTPPGLKLAASPGTLTPDGDGVGDTKNIVATLSEHSSLTRTIVGPTGRTVSTWAQSEASAGANSGSWNGCYSAAAGSAQTSVPTGLYRVTVTAQDDAGNRAVAKKTIRVDSYLLVVLDPGHGGLVDGVFDSGAQGTVNPSLGVLNESLVNLQIACGRMGTTSTAQKGVGMFLGENTATGREIRVRFTRTKERAVGLTLTRRAQISNYYGPSVFVAIHNNDADSHAAAGTETLYIPGSTQGYYLARRLQARIKQEVAKKNWAWKDRGLVDGSWLSLAHNIRSPMALVEGGFVNNPTENKLLRTDAYREALAKGISEGIVDYLRYAERAGWLWQ